MTLRVLVAAHGLAALVNVKPANGEAFDVRVEPHTDRQLSVAAGDTLTITEDEHPTAAGSVEAEERPAFPPATGADGVMQTSGAARRVPQEEMDRVSGFDRGSVDEPQQP